MDAEYVLALEAHNPDRNHHRFYEFIVGRDLFDNWTLTIHYGRVGRPGQQQHFSAPDLETIQKTIAARLKRRASSPKRIGCEYKFRDPVNPQFSPTTPFFT